MADTRLQRNPFGQQLFNRKHESRVEIWQEGDLLQLMKSGRRSVVMLVVLPSKLQTGLSTVVFLQPSQEVSLRDFSSTLGV